MIKPYYIAAILVGLACISLPAMAFTSETNPLYVGVALGLRSSTGLDCLAGAPCSARTRRGAKIYGGYELDSKAGVSTSIELAGFTAGDLKAGFQAGAARRQGSGSFAGLGIAYKAAVKVDRLSFDMRIGGAYTRGAVDFAGGGSSARGSFGLVYGLGVSYAIDSSWSLNLGWDRVPVRFGDAARSNVHMFTVGAGYKF